MANRGGNAPGAAHPEIVSPSRLACGVQGERPASVGGMRLTSGYPGASFRRLKAGAPAFAGATDFTPDCRPSLSRRQAEGLAAALRSPSGAPCFKRAACGVQAVPPGPRFAGSSTALRDSWLQRRRSQRVCSHPAKADANFLSLIPGRPAGGIPFPGGIGAGAGRNSARGRRAIRRGCRFRGCALARSPECGRPTGWSKGGAR